MAIYQDLFLDRGIEASKRVYERILASIKKMNFESLFLAYILKVKEYYAILT